MGGAARIRSRRPGGQDRKRASGSDAGGHDRDGVAAVDFPIGTDGRARRVAFRTLTVVLVLWLLVLSVFGLTEVVFMWLSVDTLAGILGEQDEAVRTPGYIPMHRSHLMAAGLMSWAIVLSALVQLRRPARRVAPMLLLTVLAVTALVVYSFTGTPGEWLLEEWTWVLPVLLLAVVLHPARRELWRLPGYDRVQLWLAAVAAVPWAWYGVASARLQLIDDGEHALLEHWGSAAMLAVAVGGGALIGASRHPGWPLPAWIAAVASVVFGAHSLVFPGAASGLPVFWALAAVVWGMAFAVATAVRSRRAVGAPS